MQKLHQRSVGELHHRSAGKRQGRSVRRLHQRLRASGVAPALALAGLLALQPAVAHAADAKHVGVGMACALGNVLYGPTKILVALIGTLTSGLGYAVTAGDIDVARKILDSSVMGDYVIEPAHLTGQKPLVFIGDTTPQATDDWGTPPPESSGF